MRSLAQRVALIFGVVFILVALGGFLTPGGTGMEAHPDNAPKELGLFPINLLHNIVHLLFGVWGIAASRTWGAAKTYCQVSGARRGNSPPLPPIFPVTLRLCVRSRRSYIRLYAGPLPPSRGVQRGPTTSVALQSMQLGAFTTSVSPLRSYTPAGQTWL